MDELRTERLVLRRARREDAAAFHQILRDPVAMRYWSSLPHANLAVTQAWVDDMIAAPADESCDFVVERDGQVIGKAGCWRLPEIGYILAPSAWGQGYAREALQAIIPHVFARYPIPAIKADVDPHNHASVGLLKRLGFVETGRAANTWEIGGVWSDSVYFALPRPDVS